MAVLLLAGRDRAAGSLAAEQRGDVLVLVADLVGDEEAVADPHDLVDSVGDVAGGPGVRGLNQPAVTPKKTRA